MKKTIENTITFPKDVEDVDLAFPASVRHLLPEYESVPQEFHRGDTKWNKLFADWFFSGIKKLNVKWKAEIDGKKAIRHIKCCMGSYEPKHEHKEAGVAYLFSLWADDATWEKVAKS